MSELKHIPTATDRQKLDKVWRKVGYHMELEIADLRADRERLHSELQGMIAERDGFKAAVKEAAEVLREAGQICESEGFEEMEQDISRWLAKWWTK